MKKHFYSLLAIMAFLFISGFLSPLRAQTYCYPKFPNGGCGTYYVTGISISPGSFSSSPSCVTSGVDTSGLSGTGIVVYRGKTYSLTINGSTAEAYAGYIDYQHDGSFEDIGDFVADDDNGYTTITDNITIPLNATPVVTRMRVIAANYLSSGTVFMGPTTDCAAPGGGSYTSGSSEDYKITITAYPKDIGIIALTPAYCPNKKEPVQVIIQNIGLNNLSSIPFTFKVGTTTVNATYSRLLASNTQDTFTIGTFDASVAGTYNLQIYASLSGDGDRTNDTINASLHIAQPASPTTNASTMHCGPGSVWLDAKSTTAKSSTYWFTTDTGTVIYKKNIDSIKTPLVPIGQTDTYYAESRFDTRDTLSKGVFSSSARSNYGNDFDIFAKNLIIIDSLDVNMNETGGFGSDSCAVWYRVGTAAGYQNDRSAWTHIATVPVTPSTSGLTRVALPHPITLQTGVNYGFYTYAVNFTRACYYDLTYQSDNPEANADLSVNAINSLGPNGPFNGLIQNGRDWNGRIYYHLNACPSPRVPVSVKMLQNPNGAYLSKGIPFGGKYNKGDEVHSDQVCTGDTNTYMIEPPTGMAESDYGTKWTVNSIAVATVRGTVLTQATTGLPTTTKKGFVQLYPSATYSDSVFIIGVDMKTPATGCDSIIYRFVTVNARPVADFSFSNPCGNIAVDFTDLSSVKSSIDTVKTWLWDFGDGSTTNLNRKTPYPHLYPGVGSYNVSLTVTSSSGCPASITKTLKEFSVPVAKFGTKLACNTRPITFIDSSTVATPDKVAAWNWTFGDNSGSAIQKPVHTYPKSGPYTVKLVVTSNNGCKDSLTKSLRIEPLPEPKSTNGGVAFTINNKCVGSGMSVSPNIIPDSTPSVLPTFTWNFGDSTANTALKSHTYTKNGTYSIMMIVLGGDGCIDTFTRSNTPLAQPVPKITFVPKCVNQTIAFVDSSGSAPPSTYDWYFGDGASDLGGNSPSVSHAYSATGVDTVKLTITNGYNCVGSGSIPVFIPGLPTAAFTADSVCLGGTTVFNNTSSGVSSPGGYVWDFGDASAIDTSANPTHKYASAGTYSVKLVATSRYDCIAVDTMSVNVNPLPVIDKWTTKEHNLQFTFTPADPSIGTFKWFFSPTDSQTVASPTNIYPASDDGKYQAVKLYVTNSFGCTSERTDSVLVEKSGIEVTGTTFDGITVFPNPFEGTTNISYSLQAKSHVNITVYDAEGKLVAKLKDGMYGAGAYNDAFDAKKYNASEGVYFLKMYVNDKYYTTRIINLK